MASKAPEDFVLPYDAEELVQQLKEELEQIEEDVFGTTGVILNLQPPPLTPLEIGEPFFS